MLFDLFLIIQSEDSTSIQTNQFIFWSQLIEFINLTNQKFYIIIIFYVNALSGIYAFTDLLMIPT